MTKEFSPYPIQWYDFIWDGKNADGQTASSTTLVNVKLTNIGLSGEESTDSSSVRIGRYNASTAGLGSWTISSNHFLDREANTIYLGNGRSQKVEPINYQNLLMVPSSSADQAYLFDQDGKHLKTINALTGAIKYSFEYIGNKLSSIKDAYGNKTLIYQDRIISLYGHITLLSYDENNYLKEVINPNNEAHKMTYSPDGLLLRFEKPEGQISHFSYDASGFLKKDEGAGGNFLELLREATDDGWKIKSSSAEGRVNEHLIASDGIKSSRTTTDARGLQYSSVSDPQGTSKSVSPEGLVSESFSTPDPRFGNMASYTSQSTISVPNSPLLTTVETNKEVKLYDINDPLNLFELKETTIKDGDITNATIIEYNNASKINTITTAEGRKLTLTYNDKGDIIKVQRADLEPTVTVYDSKGRESKVVSGNRVSNYSYDAKNNLIQVQDPAGKITKYKHDLNGRVVLQIDPLNNKTQFRYDKNGNLVGITPAGKAEHEFKLNLLDIKV